MCGSEAFLIPAVAAASGQHVREIVQSRQHSLAHGQTRVGPSPQINMVSHPNRPFGLALGQFQGNEQEIEQLDAYKW